MKKYSKQEIEQIQKEVETTLKTIKQIAIENNISKNTIQSWCIKYKWKRPKEFKKVLKETKTKSKIIKDEEYYKLKNLYENTSIPVTEIAKQSSLSLTQIWNRVHEGNWKRDKSLIKEMNSNKFKNIMANLTTEQKQIQKQKMSETNKKIWQERSEEQKQLIVQHRKNTMKTKSKEEITKINQKISKSVKTTWNNYDLEKRLQLNKKLSNIQQNLSPEKRKIKAIRDRNTKLKNNSFKNITKIDGIRLDSNYKVAVYEFCKRNNIPIKTQIPIQYNYNNKLHTTFIDFEIDGMLFECKGGHLLKGVYDYKLPVPIEKKLEVYKENNVILITDNFGSQIIPNSNSKLSNGLKYLDKCPNPLIGIDIELFKNPKFPYAIDKPKCFYKVKVDGKLSAIEAWNNELIRWKMIKNRINYVGGYINNKSILTAMNVTRTCKQPSWFDKNYAKQLIEKYITTNTIIDPFAGWGTRCDACKELGNINYYGWDLNKELVEWHHQLNRTFDTGCGIEYGDANNIKTVRENCSVFICPPYTNKEIYFEEQNIDKTQCEWLTTIIKNIPNAKEYLMVCKVVDPGWEQFVVEEKINKSHFGINKEYVICITNEMSKILMGN